MDEKTLAAQIRAILTQIEARQAIHSRPVFATLHDRYEGLLRCLEGHGRSDELRKHSICGSVRAYLDACSSYDDPLLEEMHRAEKGYLELLEK